MEALATAFAGVLKRAPLAAPFAREIIVVQSRGMQRWLSIELAGRLGVWANADFPFPNALLFDLFSRVGLAADASCFSKESMQWRLMGLLTEERLSGAAFAPLRAYLAGDGDGLKRFQLSGKIADVFDQYTLFRPEMLSRWEAGESMPEAWQAELWRALVAGTTGLHRGQLGKAFCRRLAESDCRRFLPERISLFGISYLPPFHLEILAAVAGVTQVNMFLVSPTQHYWGDIVPLRSMNRMPSALREASTEGNPLLASLGRSGRDFSEMVIDLDVGPDFDEDVGLEASLSVDPGHDTLLHALQSDILNLVGTGSEGRHLLEQGDRSVQVHSCHSPMREVEVLHDNLLELFSGLPGLEPRDILVMTPDIELYAPYITTVFGSADDGLPLLPFTIADRKLSDEGQVASSILRLLDLYGSRCTAPAVFDLLSSPPVSGRFGIDAEEIGTIRSWIESTRIRWGLHAGDRDGRSLPAYEENSWRAGLDRLLLGYAMPDEGVLFDGILPAAGVEGPLAVTLGKFLTFIDRLEAFLHAMTLPAGIDEWRSRLAGMVETFIMADAATERELSRIHEEIASLGQIAAIALPDEALPAAVMLSWLRAKLEQAEQGLGFMTGGITFSAMLPMRSIPFRVLAMLGMHDGAFPRQQRSADFDLIARHPRPGDRSVRGDDRYLFLESVLSARDVLYISYTGQSEKDNAEIPPSVLIGELLDAIDRGFELANSAGDGGASSVLITRHRLQGFHPDYFTGDSKLFSFSADNCRALDARYRQQAPHFAAAPLASPAEEELKNVSLERLAKFYANPAAFFLEERLGMRAGSATSPLEDREPFAVTGLDAYLIRKELLEAKLAGGETDPMLPMFRSRGMLPPALHGEQVFRQLEAEVSEFADQLQPYLDAFRSQHSVAIDLHINGFRLTGTLQAMVPGSQLFFRCASMKETDRIRAWISHLAMQAAFGHGEPAAGTVLVMRDRALRYASVAAPEELLGPLLDAYRAGLCAPLPFFPRASTAWAEKAGQDEEKRFAAALSEWEDGFGGRTGEGADHSFRRCFGQQPPFGAEFREIADNLLRPMLEHGETL